MVVAGGFPGSASRGDRESTPSRGKGHLVQIPSTAGPSQTSVEQIAQDDDGFMWFGTPSGLNRFDSYKCKVFKHDLTRPGSLSGVNIYSLFKDRSGALWVGSD
jgi:ligand-binding sensor domain-containing protein